MTSQILYASHSGLLKRSQLLRAAPPFLALGGMLVIPNSGEEKEEAYPDQAEEARQTFFHQKEQSRY